MWLWLVGALFASPPPGDQTVIYYNARMALREARPQEVVKLWLLRNAVRDQTGEVSPHDPDFHSLIWAALGELGVCQDGLEADKEGAGLWTLALHNWVVRNLRRRMRPQQPRPFDAFTLNRQQRFVAVGDVLSTEEMRTVELFRGRCLRPRLALTTIGELPTADLSDRQVAARLLGNLLERAAENLDEDVVRGRSVISARLFDINLQLMAIAAREARQQTRDDVRQGRLLGMSRTDLEVIRADADAYAFPSDSDAARILRDSVTWPISEWMALRADRRLFLFRHARDFVDDPEQIDRISLGVIDALIVQGDGEEVEKWIAHRGVEASLDAETPIWSGERGRRLLALDPESGFQERSVIALRRGVSLLEAGDLPGALRLMAYAIRYAPESRERQAVENLSLRWLSYISSQFEVSESLLVTLQELVPRRDYAVLLEDMLWSSALRADRSSFDRAVMGQVGRGALERRAEAIQPLAAGDIGRFLRNTRRGLRDTPGETLKLLEEFLNRLEAEDADIRSAHIRTLAELRELLRPLSIEAGSTGRQSRRATELMDRSQAIVEGLGQYQMSTTRRDRARALNPDTEVFAGSLRLAPTDPLPWPFRPAEIAAPSIFAPVDLIPEERRAADGEVIFGWRIEG
ncbi:MAG: hypothetical protein AAFV53_38200 [Myxococcota bacterium]